MYGITLNGQDLTGNFRGFALKAAARIPINDQFQLGVSVHEEDVLVLGQTFASEPENEFSVSDLTPAGIALRSKRAGQPVEIACNAQPHTVEVAVFSPTFRRQEAYGLEVYNERGDIAYGSADHYLSPTGTVALPFGEKADLTRIGYPTPSPIYFWVPRGKRYGVVLGSWGEASANLSSAQINRHLSSHPLYRRHNFYYFGYYCAIAYPPNVTGQISFRLGSSGLPPDVFYGRGRTPTQYVQLVDISQIQFNSLSIAEFQRLINR